MMKLLANENFPLTAVKFIESNSHNIVHVGRDYAGVSDKDVMKLAIEERRTILTFDRDYGELIFKYDYHPPEGVIYMRLSHYKPVEPGKIIVDLLHAGIFSPKNKLTVITKSGIRQRKY